MMEIYHGSNVIVENPVLLIQGFYKDFGYGFYCTKYENQAKRWAITKRTPHIVNVYEYREDKELNRKVQQDSNLVDLLSKYHHTKDDKLKQEILNSSLFREYKKQEAELNLLILEINSKLKQITKKDKCQL